MKKYLNFVVCTAVIAAMVVPTVHAASAYTVVLGDTMWKIAVKNEIGVSEIKNANPQVSDPDLIYPGQVLNVPEIDEDVLQFELEVIRLVNEIRASNGLSELKYNWELCRVARYKSQDMKDKRYFSHTSPTYGSPFKMISDFGLTYRSAGENIARGMSSPKTVVDAWMNSSGHRANILNSSYTEIGVGYVAEGNYWTQMFIRK